MFTFITMIYNTAQDRVCAYHPLGLLQSHHFPPSVSFPPAPELTPAYLSSII